MEDKKCLCGEGDYVVLACSGASDVGHITDLVARKLSKNGVRKMNCLAVAGAGIEKSIESFKKSNLLILDGCSVDCGKKIASSAGIENFNYLRVTDLGFKKGGTGVSDTVVNAVSKRQNSFIEPVRWNISERSIKKLYYEIIFPVSKMSGCHSSIRCL